MRELYREEKFAMLFWHEEYAAQPLGAIEFYRTLAPESKRLVDTLVGELEQAKRMPKVRSKH